MKESFEFEGRLRRCKHILDREECIEAIQTDARHGIKRALMVLCVVAMVFASMWWITLSELRRAQADRDYLNARLHPPNRVLPAVDIGTVIPSAVPALTNLNVSP